jgi:hypothetical protein
MPSNDSRQVINTQPIINGIGSEEEVIDDSRESSVTRRQPVDPSGIDDSPSLGSTAFSNTPSLPSPSPFSSNLSAPTSAAVTVTAAISYAMHERQSEQGAVKNLLDDKRADPAAAVNADVQDVHRGAIPEDGIAVGGGSGGGGDGGSGISLDGRCQLSSSQPISDGSGGGFPTVARITSLGTHNLLVTVAVEKETVGTAVVSLADLAAAAAREHMKGHTTVCSTGNQSEAGGSIGGDTEGVIPSAQSGEAGGRYAEGNPSQRASSVSMPFSCPVTRFGRLFGRAEGTLVLTLSSNQNVEMPGVST